MRDPFPIPPPPLLVKATKPIADFFGLSTLPLHAHEVLFAFSLYTFVHNVGAPVISNYFAGHKYRRLSRRNRTNWNVHIVSFVQSCIINAISLWIIWGDKQRMGWREAGKWEERIWGYDGLTGMCQSFALGYFLWDLVMCAWKVEIFGWGMLAHAISAVCVFGLGYRPFIYFYAPVFLLYELSSPFLNIHWFCDKLDLTGSVYQAVNGAILTITFFCCRIVWGLYSSFNVFYDMYVAVQAGHSVRRHEILGEAGEARKNWESGDLSLYYKVGEQERAFMSEEYIPLWLVITYLASNVVLNLLNVYWFGKMIETIRKRFDPPWGTKGIGSDYVYYEEPEKIKIGTEADKLRKVNKGSVKAARMNAEEALNGDVNFEVEGTPEVQRGIYADGHKSVEVSGSTRKSAKSRRKA